MESNSRDDSSQFRINCSHCQKSYADRKGLARHIKQCHPERSDESGSVLCPFCLSARFCRITSIETHIKEIHSLSMDHSELMFGSYDDFSRWKSAEEESTSSNFVMHGGSVVKEYVKRTYFYCNKSGESRKGRKSGARSCKMQETSKIGTICVAHIKVEQNMASGNCKVNYDSTHCGHKKELAHIRFPDSSRVKIASQLQAGVSINNILDSIRDVSLNEGMKHEHLIVRQYITNIERVLNLSNIQKHANDQTSVAIWVQEALTQPYNPVLVFKPQGRKDSVVGHSDDLEEKNFILAIQTEFQRNAMKKFAGNGRVVCVNATHGTNVYDSQ